MTRRQSPGEGRVGDVCSPSGSRRCERQGIRSLWNEDLWVYLEESGRDERWEEDIV